MKHVTLVSFVLAASAAAYACSSDDTTATPATTADAGSDAGGAADTGTAADSGNVTDAGTVDTGIDAGPVPIACTEAELDAPTADFRGTDAGGQGAGGADISFPNDDAPAQYVNRCVKIKVGQTVTFAGAFAKHPLQAFGGDSPSPIPALTNVTPDAGVLEVTFTTAGEFGFRCNFHPNFMRGAVKVVP